VVGLTLTAETERVVWHDVECASYDADLPLWRELAASARGPVLDVGSGTGRVALDLAGRGHDVYALDADSALVDALAERAREHGLRVHTQAADARTFSVGGGEGRFALAIAPMQVVQLLGSAAGRTAAIERVRDHLKPGGIFALAIADPFEGEPADLVGPPLPDVREQDGWVFQSQPIAVRPVPGGSEIDRIRQAVSPTGELSESFNTIRLDDLTAEELERDGVAAGMRALPRRVVPPIEDYVGSTVVILRKQ
jgi:SAM-dependent methyltransferase